MEKFKFSSSILSNILFLIVSVVIFIFPITTTAQMIVIKPENYPYWFSFVYNYDGTLTYLYYTGYLKKCPDETCVFVTTINFNGNVKWVATLLQYAQRLFTVHTSINKTTDGGFVVTGGTGDEIPKSFYHGSWITDPYTMGFIAKFDSAGNFQKAITIWNAGGGFKSSFIYILSACQIYDDIFAFLGRDNIQYNDNSYEEYFFVGIADLKSGNVNIYRVTSVCYRNCISRTNDSGFIFVGTIKSPNSNESSLYICKYGNSGIWAESISGFAANTPSAIIQTNDGGYVITGTTNMYEQGRNDIFVLKIDSAGNIQWARTIGGSDDDFGFGIIQTRDNGYAIIGSTKSFGQGGYDIYFVKLDANGYLQWTRTIGADKDDGGYYIYQDKDGSYLISALTYSFGGSYPGDILVAKLDSTGYVDIGPCGALGEGGGAVVANPVASKLGASLLGNTIRRYTKDLVTGGPTTDTAIVYVCSPFPSIEDSKGSQGTHNFSENYPNPFNTTTTIKFTMPYACRASIRIYNLLGEEIAKVVDDSLSEGEHRVEWRPEKNLSPGVYFARIQACNEIKIQKIILE
jgi:hypothetical protein